MGNHRQNPVGRVCAYAGERANHTPLRSEQGFTYVEWVLSLMILSLIIPTFFFSAYILEQEMKKRVNEQRLQMEYLSFLSYIHKELKTASHFRTEQGALLFELPTGETIRYQQKKREIIRQVRQPDQSHFQGLTVLLQHVSHVLFTTDQRGITIAVGLQNEEVAQEQQTYIAMRNPDEGD